MWTPELFSIPSCWTKEMGMLFCDNQKYFEHLTKMSYCHHAVVLTILSVALGLNWRSLSSEVVCFQNGTSFLISDLTTALGCLQFPLVEKGFTTSVRSCCLSPENVGDSTLRWTARLCAQLVVMKIATAAMTFPKRHAVVLSSCQQVYWSKRKTAHTKRAWGHWHRQSSVPVNVRISQNLAKTRSSHLHQRDAFHGSSHPGNSLLYKSDHPISLFDDEHRSNFSGLSNQ